VRLEGREHHPAIAGAGEPARPAASREGVALVGEAPDRHALEAHHRLLLRDVDVLAEPRPGPAVDGGQRAERGDEARVVLAEVSPGTRRGAIALARRGEGRGVPGGVVEVEVMAPMPAARSGLAEGGDRRDDETRVAAGQYLVAEPQRSQSARRPILDQHVGPPGERRERAPTRLRSEVEAQRALARVEIEEERAAIGVRLAVGSGTAPARRVTALRVLHLDHVRPEIGQQLRAVGRRHHLAELEDRETGEGARRVRSCFPHGARIAQWIAKH
jgi:hypothetical protein